MSGLKNTILSAIGTRLMAQGTIEEIDVVSDHFRLITVSSQKFKEATMQPAAKVRLNVGNWEMRAYTPLAINTATGRIQILAYLHGQGPGSIWVRSVVPGDTTYILGPQQSLDLLQFSQPAVFFGDETSFAAAKTLQSHLAPNKATRFVFEISSVVEAQAVASRLDIRDAEYYERQPNDSHIPLITETIQRALVTIATPNLVLTGNGRSIQAIRAGLRTRHSGSINYHVKAYWAPGKTGLE